VTSAKLKFSGNAADDEKWLAWMRLIFVTPEAYLASLPSRIWIRGEAGWTSMARDTK